ncbi:hypothetical protein GOBAR_AA00143 [Gossypium barbadense]|uniref:CCHC-type domain-containing protein n=1 Tax=Gossypium barbadense TaxID=3634 RepID=A0A2P5YXZ1_GOSBA|nr:hypothetical protein GOBAR_AA00143 [Gossypium barbadense]
MPVFCFGCGRLGHGVKECNEILLEEREKVEDEQSYSVALKAESNLLGGESPSKVVPEPNQQTEKKMESAKDSIILESNNVQQKFEDTVANFYS